VGPIILLTFPKQSIQTQKTSPIKTQLLFQKHPSQQKLKPTTSKISKPSTKQSRKKTLSKPSPPLIKNITKKNVQKKSTATSKQTEKTTQSPLKHKVKNTINTHIFKFHSPANSSFSPRERSKRTDSGRF
jgi:hypothetical protein